VSFAKGTVVPVERTRAEIEKTIMNYGADEFSSAFMNGQAAIQFRVKERRVRFVLDLPSQEWARGEIMSRKRPRWYDRRNIPANILAPLVDAEHRRRWRCLLLAIKAKLEIVDSGIATFDEEFLAHIVIDDGQDSRTVYERVVALTAGGGRPLLPPVR
jgi:hypothetical protein